MSEIIERGAEAMKAKRRELINQPLERIWPDLMRAALGVMREPTDEMLEVGGTNHNCDDRMDVAASWPLMIDAALNEKRPGRQLRQPGQV